MLLRAFNIDTIIDYHVRCILYSTIASVCVIVIYYLERIFVGCYRSGSTLGCAGPIDVFCKTCSVLLCLLEQTRVDNASVWPFKRGVQYDTIGPVSVWSILVHLYNLCPILMLKFLAITYVYSNLT